MTCRSNGFLYFYFYPCTIAIVTLPVIEIKIQFHTEEILSAHDVFSRPGAVCNMCQVFQSTQGVRGLEVAAYIFVATDSFDHVSLCLNK